MCLDLKMNIKGRDKKEWIWDEGE